MFFQWLDHNIVLPWLVKTVNAPTRVPSSILAGAGVPRTPADTVCFSVWCDFRAFSRLVALGAMYSAEIQRWLVREESRILGVFGADIIETDANGQEKQREPRPRLPPFPSGFKD